MTLLPGSLVANRFEIDRQAGSGGMGTVYRARDRDTNSWVALKILLPRDNAQAALRFSREADLLAELSHPGIVSYVAHGQTLAAQDYLAMEWLDGEDLSARLLRGPLSVAESLSLLCRVAEALSGPHHRGIIHRDLKPSNLFLLDGQIERVKILDFGIARRAGHSRAMTQTGMVIGTPEYMAPEQVRAQHEIGPAADIFSLGCVLHECLTGQPPFVSEHIAAVLAKILFEEPRLLRNLLPNPPEALETLLARMLAKDVTARLPSADALLAELRTLPQPLEGLATPTRETSKSGLTDSEQRLVSVIVATASLQPGTTETISEVAAKQQRQQLESLQIQLCSYGANVELLADGSLVATLTRDRGSATDQVALAARLAMLVRERWSEAVIALITDRIVDKQRETLGQILDRAGRLLGSAPGRSQMQNSDEILLDSVTAGLLETRFRLRRTASDIFSLDVRDLYPDATRLLLGKPTPCVGREPELSALESILTSCLEEAVPRAALVVAHAGAGKSRVRHEFLRRLAIHHKDILVLSGFGDPMGAGSAYGLLRQALRSLCGIVDGEDESHSRAKLAERVASHLSDQQAQRIVPLIGELCGLFFPDDGSMMLKAARREPMIMAERIHEAFVEWVAEESARRPMLLVLEDLQWSDRLTVRLVDAALRLSNRSLMVLALARPEVEETFPKLWSGVVQVNPLRPLSKRACERLVVEILGSDLSKSNVDRLVEQSAGNPLYLEELIRIVPDGGVGELPGTVLAMLHARLMRLDPETRRVLRAASVFGETFWQGGVRALLMDGRTQELVPPLLEQLVGAELIERHIRSRLAGEIEYRFRHALMREAAYDMLVKADCVLGHRLAALFLEQAGETSPMVLADHHERGGEVERALTFYLRAAERAFWGGDGDTALGHARHCLDLGAKGPERLAVLSIMLLVLGWRADWLACKPIIAELLQTVPPDSPSMGAILIMKSDIEMVDSKFDIAVDSLVRALELPPIAHPATLFGLSCSIWNLGLFGKFDLAQTFMDRLSQIVEPTGRADPTQWGWLALGHAYQLEFLGEASACIIWADDSYAAHTEAGNRRAACAVQNAKGHSLWLLGRHEEACRELKEAMALGPELGPVYGHGMAYWVLALAARGLLTEAKSLGESFLAAVRQRQMRIEEGLGRWALCDVLARQGALVAAEEEARHACLLLDGVAVDYLMARLWHADILLRLNRPADSLEIAESALAQFRLWRGRGERIAFARLLYVESLYAVGRVGEAHAALAEAHTILISQADAIADPALRRIFLENVPEHSRILARCV